MYVRKTVDAWVLEGNYGCGWEYLLTEYTKKEGMERLREYRENQPQYPVRLIKKRERKAAAVWMIQDTQMYLSMCHLQTRF